MVVKATIYAIPKFPVCKITVFTVKTLMSSFVIVDTFYIDIYFSIFYTCTR